MVDHCTEYIIISYNMYTTHYRHLATLCYSPNAAGSVETLDEQTETESVVSFRRERPRHRESMESHGTM